MRAFYSIWKSLVNGALIVLPVIILGLFVVQFGQPLVELYRDYFLGDPTQELVVTSRAALEKKGSEVPFDQFERQFNGVRTLEQISDTDLVQLRRSVVRIHGSVVSRLGSGNIEGLHESYADSYTRLLRNPMINRVFDRPDLLQNRLLNDVDRLGKLPALPSHPARGLESFWTAGDTVVRLVQRYGDIYADQVACRNVFGLDCGLVYAGSAELTAQYVSQYFSNWPEFSRSLSSEPVTFESRIQELYGQYVTFTRRLEGYLRAAPWAGRKELNQAFKTFGDHYEQQLQFWFGDVLAGINLATADFSERQWTKDFTILTTYREIERRLEENVDLRRTLLTEQNENRRENLRNHLASLYSEVTARHHFDPDYEASSDGMNSLRRTLEAFPGGRRLYEDHKEQLEQARGIHRRLRAALENENYDLITESLGIVFDRISSDTAPEPWNTLVREFLMSSRNVITRPDWQPDSGEGTEVYRQMISQYGRLGQMLDVPELSEEWVENTLLALKSRRFNQLKHRVRRNLTGVSGSRDMKAVIRDLENLLSLEDLPDELGSQVDLILGQAILVERLETGGSTLRERFDSRLGEGSRILNRWNQLEKLLGEGAVTVSGSAKLEDALSYVNRWKDWIQSTNTSTRLGEHLRERSVNLLDRYLLELTENFRERVASGPEGSAAPEALLKELSDLREVLKSAKSISGYQPSPELAAWGSVLEIRRALLQINEAVNELRQGSLWGSNESYQQYVQLAEDFEWSEFPLDYEARAEAELLRSIFGTLRDRAHRIQSASQDDWFQGWGGRITPSEVLTPWESLLKRVRRQSRHPRISSTTRELLDSISMLRRELEGKQ